MLAAPTNLPQNEEIQAIQALCRVLMGDPERELPVTEKAPTFAGEELHLNLRAMQQQQRGVEISSQL